MKQGASTITQQYAKNAYLSHERTWSRKVKEVVIAVKLDQAYSKDRSPSAYDPVDDASSGRCRTSWRCSASPRRRRARAGCG